MPARRSGPFMLVAALAIAGSSAGAQWRGDPAPFGAGAIMVGAQGFARPPITSAVAGGYVHLPLGVMLAGAQFGRSFAEDPRESRATYAVGTLAYAQRRAPGLQIYPYVALGSAALRTRPGDVAWRPAFGGGFGVDARTGAGERGLMLGARVGYLTRSLADDESIAYAVVGVGFGGRHASAEKPPVVARRE